MLQTERKISKQNEKYQNRTKKASQQDAVTEFGQVVTIFLSPVAEARPHSQSIFFYFHAVFCGILCKNNPHLGLVPLWEILDPPLETYRIK